MPSSIPSIAASSASSASSAPALPRPRALARTSRALSLGSTLCHRGKGLPRPPSTGSGCGIAPMPLLLRKKGGGGGGGGAPVVAALADRPPPPSSPPLPSSSPVSFDLPLGSDAPPGCRLSVRVFAAEQGKKDSSSVVEVTLSGLPSGRALLHWGVTHSSASEAWKLPGEACRPRGTLNYKNRALQTPFGAAVQDSAEGGAAGEGETTSSSSSSSSSAASILQRLTLSFPAAERASALVFVLKDVGTGVWLSPPGGGNFEVPLQEKAASEAAAANAAAAAAAAEAEKSKSSSASSSFSSLVDADLVSAWAYATWQAEGSPARSRGAAAAAERAAAEQLRDLVASSSAAREQRVEALRLAAASSAAFEAFWAGLSGPEGDDPWGAALAAVPQDLVAVAAYLLWEGAGRPEGADFGGAARRRLAARLRAGGTVEALRRELTGEGGGEEERGKKEEEERRRRDEKRERREREKAAAEEEQQQRAAAAAAAADAAVVEEEAKKQEQAPPSPPPAEEPQLRASGGDNDAAAAAATLGAPADGVPSLDPLSLIKGPPPSSSSSSSSPLTPAAHACPLGPLEDAASRDEACVWHRAFGLGGGYTLLAAVRLLTPPPAEDGKNSSSSPSSSRITLTTDLPDPVSLHWGVRPSRKARKRGKGKGGDSDWLPPPDSLLPAGSAEAPGGGAAETPLAACADADCLAANVSGDPVRLRRVAIDVPASLEASGDVAALVFVLRADDGTKWWRDGGGNFAVPLARAGSAPDGSRDPLSGYESDDGRSSGKVYESCAFEDELSCDIVECELGSKGWTLMHRFNRAADLLERELRRAEKLRTSSSSSPQDADEAAAAALSTIFVWLRYSAARHLTWQRNYNTQPRLLGEAQSRLSAALAAAHGALRGSGEAQEWARAALSCVGRGQGAQAVRDEILNIMHRHKIPEKAGTWMEQWHQKLHNNTTPDDVAICEAYLNFLDRGGDAGAYWATLSDAGIDRARLESFDRAITCEPEDFPDKREGLSADLRRYLGILKGVHSGADLSAAAAAVGDGLPAAARPHVGALLFSQSQGNGNNSGGGSNGNALATIQHAVAARAAIAPSLAGNRDLLYLDLALEDSARRAAEAAAGAARGGRAAAALVGPLLANLALSLGDNEDTCRALKAWEDAPKAATSGFVGFGGGGSSSAPPLSEDDALRAAAAADRARRAVARAADAVQARIGDKADALGGALGVEPWARDLFVEEVVRGGPAFGASLALSAAEPALRAAAQLEPWQVVSPGKAVGVLRLADSLHELAYDDLSAQEEGGAPVVLLVARVSGEEEPPTGAAAVLTGDAPDTLSHLAVRARNMGVVLAACWEQGPLEALRELEGKVVAVSTTAAGGVAWREATREELPESGGGGAAVAGAAASSKAPSSASSSSSSASASSSSESGGVEEEGPLSALLRRAASFGAPSSSSSSSSPSQQQPAMKDVKPPKWCGKWAVSSDEFADGVVGAKSKNLAALRGKKKKTGASSGGEEEDFPSWIKLPPSATLPFGTFEAVLDDAANAEQKRTIAASNAALEAGARGAAAVAALDAASAAAMSLSIPQPLKVALADKMREAGIVPVPSSDADWDLAFSAMRSVWASQFNELALVSMRRVGLPRDALRMAVLVQKVVPAAYAFVIHTRNPATGDAGEVFCELVAGLGEAIVSGAVPGSALAFAARKDKLEEAVDLATGKVKTSSSENNDVARVLSYPSKGAGFFVPESLIFRSDSNGEDLPGYAGAGLYSSVSSAETVLKTVDYGADRLMTDSAFRAELMLRVAAAGLCIERACGGKAQDVEGCIDAEGNLFCVQTRPQV